MTVQLHADLNPPARQLTDLITPLDIEKRSKITGNAVEDEFAGLEGWDTSEITVALLFGSVGLFVLFILGGLYYRVLRK
jgi:hypothetical protein